MLNINYIKNENSFKRLVMPICMISIGLGCLGAAAWISQKSEGSPSDSSLHEVIRPTAEGNLRLGESQHAEIRLGAAQTYRFNVQRDAIGIIDFNQDRVVQIFSPYQGKIGRFEVKSGDEVQKGQVLFTVQIPDLAQAASTLIAAAGTLKVTTDTLQRAQSLYESRSIALKEYQQNLADQQAADAAYKAARKTMALFGLNESQIDDVEKQRHVDTEMPVVSPFAGRVTARSGATGQLVQPGNAPAPLTVADMRQLWLVASVPESELASYRKGQAVSVKVSAWPDRVFLARVSYVGETSDPNTHRIVVRAEVADPAHLLRPQMMASFTITVGPAQTSPAVPQSAVVRESDGTTVVWVARSNQELVRRVVKTGLTQDGWVQVTEGLKAGERVAQDKALFLSNLYLTSNN